LITGSKDDNVICAGNDACRTDVRSPVGCFDAKSKKNVWISVAVEVSEDELDSEMDAFTEDEEEAEEEKLFEDEDEIDEEGNGGNGVGGSFPLLSLVDFLFRVGGFGVCIIRPTNRFIFYLIGK
jgi:hypothetical protein